MCMDKSKSYAGKLGLTCPNNQTINIFGAYFGIQPDTSTNCVTTAGPTNPALTCFNKVVYDNVNTTCGNKQSCSLIVSIDRLGDPCFLQNKQFFVQYQCVDSTFPSVKSQCNETNQDYGMSKCFQVFDNNKFDN